MEISLFIKGLLVGVAVAAPLGPIGLLCIKRSLTDGRYAGLATGLGAALGDGIFGMIAGFSLTAISSLLLSIKALLHIIGSVFLTYLGARILYTNAPTDTPAINKSKNFFTTVLETFLLTLTNPFTIVAFAAVFASLGIGSTEKNYISASLVSAGVFLGSALWFTFLSTTTSLFRTKCTPQVLLWINRISGILLILFALVLSFIKL